MICSLWKITFTLTTGPRAGEVLVLLDHGDEMEAEPKLPISQGVTASVPIFSPFGHAFAMGGAMTTCAWTRRRALPAQRPRAQALLDAYRFPWGQQGTLAVEIAGGPTWAWDRSAVESMEPSYPYDPRISYLLQSYSARCGPMRLVAGPLPADSPALWDFLVTGVCPDWENITTDWDDILLTPIT